MSNSSIYVIANNLGIKKENNAEKWTKEEDDILRSIYPRRGAAECSKVLTGRTIGAIYRRIKFLGIKSKKQ